MGMFKPKLIVAVAVVWLHLVSPSHGFSSATHVATNKNVLILDHLNINHEKGRHDWLKAFYFDFLGCCVDPRKAENLEKESKTLWANIGSNQFHLPEGKPDAQVLKGLVTLAYPQPSILKDRLRVAENTLRGSKFSFREETEDLIYIVDPWGSRFRIVTAVPGDTDDRGEQPRLDDEPPSDGVAMRDLQIDVNCDLAGIARFYEQILGAPILTLSDDRCVIGVGPSQTLTFAKDESVSTDAHVELRQEEEGFSSNYGPHISIYVADFVSTYRRVDDLGLCYVNPRFKRRAYTLDEAVDDCMFRCLDIVDPESGETLLQIEHEIRSVVKKDGSMYRSCPFSNIPDECK